MTKLLASSKPDLVFVADALSLEAPIPLAVFLLSNGLMVPQGEEWERPLAMAKLATPELREKVWGQMLNAFPYVALETLDNTVYHMLHGTDTEDSDSVGGFSQRELNMICNYLEI